MTTGGAGLLDLEAIEARCAAASPGPWALGEWSGRCHMDHYPHGRGQCLYQYKLVEAPDVVSGPEPVTIIGHDENGAILNPYNAAFIAHARQDVPALLQEVRRLRRLLESRDAAP